MQIIITLLIIYIIGRLNYSASDAGKQEMYEKMYSEGKIDQFNFMIDPYDEEKLKNIYLTCIFVIYTHARVVQGSAIKEANEDILVDRINYLVSITPQYVGKENFIDSVKLVSLVLDVLVDKDKMYGNTFTRNVYSDLHKEIFFKVDEELPSFSEATIDVLLAVTLV